MLTVLAGACAGLAVVLVLTRPPSRSWAGRAARSARTGDLRPWRAPVALLAAGGAWAFVGGAAGVFAAGVVGIAAYTVLSRAESAEAVRRREVLAADAPVAVGLVAAVLAAGHPVEAALIDVAAALPGPVADDLNSIVGRLSLGSDPVRVWRDLDDPWHRWGRAIARAHESGAAVVPAVERAADDMAVAALRRRTERARAVEVRAAAPLGLCFLPAFLLLGIVPLVAGLVTTLDLFA